ncbi:MAG: ABC transporter permease, partial [Pseudomonadota bacterium]|nr:ABC transporter permease [Pseudomonadota bacterium]
MRPLEMSIFGLVFRQTRQSGGLGLLLAALILAVTATTTLQFAADTVRDAIAQQAGQLLAADLVLSSPDPIAAEWSDRAAEQGLRQSEVVLFSSMIQANDEFA